MEGDDLAMALEPTDVMLLDTWHTFRQLRQELRRIPRGVAKALILHVWCVYPDGVRLVRAPNTIRRSSISNFESMSIQREPVLAKATDSLRSAQSLCEQLVQLEPEWAREEEEE